MALSVPGSSEGGPADADALAIAAAELVRTVHEDDRFARVTDVLVARRGEVLLHETFGGHATTARRDLFSVTKTVLALLTGIAVHEGRVALDQPVTAASRLAGHPGLRPVTVHHLLTMTRGAETGGRFDLDEVAVSGHNWATRFAAAPQLTPPGTRFHYDNGASQLLAELLHEAVGDLAAFAEARLLTPLGIDRWSWRRDPTGVPCGAGHLTMSAGSLASIGLLLCRDGRTGGDHQVVDSRWVRAMRTATTAGGPPEHRPYGMGLWVEGTDACFGAGWAGQLLWCRPRDEAVVVTMSDPGFDYGPPARDAMPADWRAPLDTLRAVIG